MHNFSLSSRVLLKACFPGHDSLQAGVNDVCCGPAIALNLAFRVADPVELVSQQWTISDNDGDYDAF